MMVREQVSPPPPRSVGWRLVRIVLFALALGYLLLMVAIFVGQRYLVFLPSHPSPSELRALAAEGGFIAWTNHNNQVIGWKIPGSNPTRGSVLIVHGNASSAVTRDYIADPIHEAEGVDVYVLEYPGYGPRPGSPSKASFDAAAEEAFQLLPTNAPRYLVSESLGTGVVCDLAARHPHEVAGMALLVPYHDLASVAQRRYWYLPAYFLLLDRFDPATALKRYSGPIKFVVAGADEVVGPESGQRLFDDYAGPKDLEVIAGAHHNDVAGQSPQWWKSVFLFWHSARPLPVYK